MLSIKNMTPNFRWTPVLIVVFTAIFRLWFLTIKPPHFDEGVNGWFIDEMAKTGFYHYDPGNYHGPLHFYILFFFQRLFGRSLWSIRLPIVIISTLTVYLVTKFDRFLDRRTCLLAALAMAVSPGVEFYGRYAIHESSFVFFLILTVWGAFGIRRFGHVRYLWAAALGLTGLILTKETYIIHVVAFGLAIPCLWIVEKIRPSSRAFPPLQDPYSTSQLCAVAVVCAGLIIFFYSGAFLDFPGLQGIYLTFSEWAKTGREGHGHEKTDYDIVLTTLQFTLGKREIAHPVIANYYWLALMARYEWPALLGLAVTPLFVWPLRNRLIRYLAIYGWGALAAYTIIHYKTPWCVITIIWPFFFVFGEFVKEMSDLIRKSVLDPLARNRAAIAPLACALLLLAGSLALAVRLNFRHYTDEDEPYVYVQTFKDIDKLTKPLFKLVAEDPSNYQLRGNVVLGSYHPLPWVLGDFTNIGWYDDTRSPDATDADFLLVDKARVEEIEKGLKHEYITESLRLRGSMDPSKLYFSYEKFHQLFPDKKADFIPGKQPPPKPKDADSDEDPQ